MTIEMPGELMDQAQRAPCSFVVDIKAFKGKGAFRSLKREHEKVVEQTHAEMHALAAEVSELDLPITLVCSQQKQKARGTLSARLRWRVRGKAAYDGFEAVQALFSCLPIQLHGYLNSVNERVQELNALEVVTRYAVTQLDTYVEHGAIKLVGKRTENSENEACVA